MSFFPVLRGFQVPIQLGQLASCGIMPCTGARAQASLGITFDVDVGTLRKFFSKHWETDFPQMLGINGEIGR